MIFCLTCSLVSSLICAISYMNSLLSSPYGKFEVKATLGWSWHIISALLINVTGHPEVYLHTISIVLKKF